MFYSVPQSPWIQERADLIDLEKNREDPEPSTQAEQRIMEWAKELQSVTEVCVFLPAIANISD